MAPVLQASRTSGPIHRPLRILVDDTGQEMVYFQHRVALVPRPRARAYSYLNTALDRKHLDVVGYICRMLDMCQEEGQGKDCAYGQCRKVAAEAWRIPSVRKSREIKLEY